MIHGSLIKMTSQMVFTLLIKKNHPNHTEHVKINLSKMIRDFFGPCPNLVFFIKIFSLKNQEF